MCVKSVCQQSRNVLSFIGTTVFCGTWNFEPSRGICPFLRNFFFHAILQNSVLDGDKGTNTAYFDGVLATVLYVYMISP